MNEKTKSELIHIAAVLVKCQYLPSDSVDDYHQKTYSAQKVATMMEDAHSRSKEFGARLKVLADSLHT